MNIEVFSYSILASILGISIVFTALILLSLLMVVLKAVFREKESKTAPTAVEKTVSARQTVPVPDSVSAVKRENNSWVIAAVAAFLAGEDSNAPRAAGWIPGTSEKSDPWMNRAAFEKEIR